MSHIKVVVYFWQQVCQLLFDFQYNFTARKRSTFAANACKNLHYTDTILLQYNVERKRSKMTQIVKKLQKNCNILKFHTGGINAVIAFGRIFFHWPQTSLQFHAPLVDRTVNDTFFHAVPNL